MKTSLKFCGITFGLPIFLTAIHVHSGAIAKEAVSFFVVCVGAGFLAWLISEICERKARQLGIEAPKPTPDTPSTLGDRPAILMLVLTIFAIGGSYALIIAGSLTGNHIYAYATIALAVILFMASVIVFGDKKETPETKGKINSKRTRE